MTEPIRMCVACRRRAAKGELVRLVATKVDRGTVANKVDRGTVANKVDRGTVANKVARGTVAVDPSARRPGRGAYLCHREECLARALRRGGTVLQRGLRAEPRQASIHADALAAQWASAVQAQQQRNGHELRPTASGRQRK